MMSPNKLTHFDTDGRVHMVDVSEKTDTTRMATASGKVSLQAETLELIRTGQIGKGDVLSVAELAGVMAAKKTSDLVPLCHPLPITNAKLTLTIRDDDVHVSATVKTTGKTGVEMEALTAVSVACLTVYDMVKAVNKEAIIGDIMLETKSGGKSGNYIRDSR